MTSTEALVEATSIDKQFSGKRNGAHRTDLIVCDDLESSKNTNTKEIVDKNIDCSDKVVIPIGDLARTSFVYMVTTVIANGLLQHVQRKLDFYSKSLGNLTRTGTFCITGRIRKRPGHGYYDARCSNCGYRR